MDIDLLALFVVGLVSGFGGATIYRRWRRNRNAKKPNVVNAMVEFQGELYISGDFDLLGGRCSIAKWDGSNWTSCD